METRIYLCFLYIRSLPFCLSMIFFFVSKILIIIVFILYLNAV